jgi:hypothetical protein
VYAYVAYPIGAGPDAEDVTSETFARALRYRKSYDAGKGTPVAWLTGIARRVIAERAGEERGTVAEVPETAAPGALEDESVERVTIQARVASLGECDRELVALRYGADLTAVQTARASTSARTRSRSSCTGRCAGSGASSRPRPPGAARPNRLRTSAAGVSGFGPVARSHRCTGVLTVGTLVDMSAFGDVGYANFGFFGFNPFHPPHTYKPPFKDEYG